MSLVVAEFQSSKVFEEIQEGVKQNPQVVKDFGAILEFQLSSKGKSQTW